MTTTTKIIRSLGIFALCCFSLNTLGQSLSNHAPLLKQGELVNLQSARDDKSNSVQMIKVLTDAPILEDYTSKEEYHSAKTDWIARNEKAYKLIKTEAVSETSD